MRTLKTEDKSVRIQDLENSVLYRTYRKAFQDATGLPLVISAADGGSAAPDEGLENENRFCKSLNGGKGRCAGCAMSHQCLISSAGEKARTARCFAGLYETAVPVRFGQSTVAFLKTGQVFDRKPTEEDFENVLAALEGEGRAAKDVADLRDAYFSAPVVPKKKYNGMVTLLAGISIQLSDLIGRMVFEQASEEPRIVTQAKQFIHANLGEKLRLEEVAAQVNVSHFYLCKLFKEATGMTFTEYVNRRRTEIAKRKLLQPHSRVTEVAFEVGFQSLSQFNRSFSRYTGCSPTEYRERTGKQNSAGALAA